MPAKVGYMSLQGHRITYLPVSIGFSVPGALIWVFIWVSEIHTNDMPLEWLFEENERYSIHHRYPSHKYHLFCSTGSIVLYITLDQQFKKL